MPDRAAAIARFLAAAGWGEARRHPLAGDASNRRYERLTDGPGGAGAVLMDAPPEKGENVGPFLAIARHLAGLGLSAPEVRAADPVRGLVLLEDLGDALYARLLERDPSLERQLYLAATDALIALHRAPPPPAPGYGPVEMVRTAGLAWDWYRPGALGLRDDVGKAAMQAALAQAFDALPAWSPVLVLRDYHAENLFWLPGRAGAARVGLIDFQDAGLGHPAYDLVSLGRDARRAVAQETTQAMIARYCDETGTGRAGFEHAAALLSAQRNLRILGVFARLSMHFSKPGYVDFIPRTWTNLLGDLSHPALGGLAALVLDGLPAPTPDILATIRDKCGTIPTL